MSIAAGELTSLAFCWTIERRDGAGLALTSHDAAVLHEGTRFEPAPGMLPAAIVRRRGLEAGSGEIDGAISNAALTEADLELGRWDGAKIGLSAIDWNSMGEPIALLNGELGAVGLAKGGFTAELAGAAAALDAPACPDTSPECRARLGDGACRVDLSARRAIAVVAAHEDHRITLAEVVSSDFGSGEMCVASGPLSGTRNPILAVEGSTLVLRDPPRAALAPGTRLWLTQGCDKRFETCRTRFANAINFRGEPHLPGNDLLTRYPGA